MILKNLLGITSKKDIVNEISDVKNIVLSAITGENVADDIVYASGITNIFEKIKSMPWSEASNAFKSSFNEIGNASDGLMGKIKTLGNRFSSFFSTLLGGSVSFGAIATGLAAVTGIITVGIVAYNNSVDGMIKKNQKLIDSNKEVYDSILEEQKTLSNNADSLKEEYENYLTATKGSEEYYNAVNKIAEISPELVVGYDNEGNAILANNDAIKAQIEYYKQLAKEKQNAAKEEAVENLDEETESYKKLENKKEKKQDKYEKSNSTLEKYEQIIKDAESGKMLSEQDVSLYNEAITSIEGVRGRVNNLREDISDLSDQLLTSGNSLRTYYTALFDTVEGELTEGQKSLRKGLVDAAIDQGWSAEEFQTIDDFIDKSYVKNAAEEIINLDDNLSEEEYRDQATAIYEKLVKQFMLTDEQQQAFKVAFGIDDETIQNSEETRENNLSLISDKVSENKLNDLTGRDILDWTKTLSNEDLQIVADIKFDENTTVESLKKLLDKAKGIVENSGFGEKFTKSQMIDTINGMSDGFDVLADIYNDILDGADFDFTKLDTKKFEEAFKGLTDEYTEFIETVSESPNDISKCQDAFNKLARAYVKNNNILENLTDENANVTAAMLKNMGVTNAEAIVVEQLALNKEKAKESTQQLADAELSEVASHIDVADGISVEEKALAQLAITKMLVNGTEINTYADAQNIYMLAQAAGVGIEKLKQLQTLMDLITKRDTLKGKENKTNNDFRALAELNRAINEFQNTALNNIEFEVDYKYESPNASEAAQKAADAYVEAFEKELDSLKILRDRGEINEKEYLDRLKVLYEKYFKDRKEYLDEFKKYETEYIQGMESLYNSAISGITKLYDKRIDAINKAKEALEEEKEAQIKALETKIDSKQEIIDGIQDEIDKMQEANDERKRQIELQKAQYNLERLQNQNTRLVKYMPDTIVI